jgi:hypothetical protein
MISSTANDLPMYREAAIDACLSAGVFPAMMENLPAQTTGAVTASARMVDEADIYVGVVGWHCYRTDPDIHSLGAARPFEELP